MSISTVPSLVSCLDLPMPEPFSGIFPPYMTLAANNGMCLNYEGSTRGGPYGANSVGPSMGAASPAAVLKVVTRLSSNSGSGSPGRLSPGTATGVGIAQRFCNYLILFWTVP